MNRRTCLSMHAILEDVGTQEAAMKMLALTSIECSRTMSELTLSLRWLFRSRSIAGVMSTARIEDPAGGVSWTPQRERPWSVCLPLRLRRVHVDREGAGAGATGLGGGAGVLWVLLRGAATAGAGARFFEAAGIGGGAGWRALARHPLLDL
jgi:hypothetical protein